MPGRVLMVQGTMSSVGKSLLVAALCRIFTQDGLRVAPFKAQNMALNSYVTRDGREIGRAQAMQAEAAGIEVTVEMNPVLIKPEADSFSQIVVLGKPWARLAARDYFKRRHELWSVITASLDTLRAEYELVIIEGAGSPVELNLKRGDVVNMAVANYADAPVLLAGDIDRGGVFAQLLGTLALLDADERARVRGLLVNKFRGDITLFADGVQILEQRGGVPVLGVIPFVRDLRVADEDSVALDDEDRRHGSETQNSKLKTQNSKLKTHLLDIAVLRLPHISNFDDFDPLRAEADVRVRFVERADDLGAPDLIIIPGTKTTIADLGWLRERGLAAQIGALARGGTPVVGICGGYQMLGGHIHDPERVESSAPTVVGLGLLPVTTTFVAHKQTVRAEGQLSAHTGLFAAAAPLPVQGYEIHMGRSVSAEGSAPLIVLRGQGTGDRGQGTGECDGTISTDGWIAGTYMHGLFDNDALRQTMLANLAARTGGVRTAPALRFTRAAEYDRLAAAVRASLAMPALYRIIGQVTGDE